MLLKRIASAAITTVVAINVFTTASSSMAINSDNSSSYNDAISKTSTDSSDGGECGENLDWNYDGIDTITINGSGDMWTIAYSDSAPWHYLKDTVKRVVITEGVQSLSRWAFYNFNSLEQVSFPSTLKTIGVDAFRKCTSLKSISIPDSVTKLDTAVFSYCTALENVRLPNKLKSIPSMAFAGCTNLSSITLPKTVKSIGSTAFTRCKFSTFIVPESVESIDYYAFSGCEELKNIFFENAGEYQIDDDENAIPETAVIHGYKGSESEQYATKYGRQFVAIEGEIEFYTYDFHSSLENMKALQDFLLCREYIGSGTPIDYDNDGRIDVFDLCLLKREFYKEAIKLQTILDSDNNGVPDCIQNEDYITDTDKDGLSDYSEIMLTATNALLPDTDENGISDYYDDNDIDSISNAEEIALGTDPLLPDSDFDNLSDSDEIKTGTNPLEPDSDKDGAADGWEVINSYDPLVYNASFDIMSSFEADEITAYVEINGNGSISDSLEVEPVLDNALLNDSIPGYIDTAFSFTTQETFDTATISFDFDSSLLDDASFEPTIYYYDESTQVLEEINTTINGNTASATVTHFSTYILLNKTEFDKVWDIEIREPNESVTSSGMSIIFILDHSGSMKDNDSTGLRYDLTEEFIDGLDEQDDCVGVITYNDSFDVVSDLTADFTSVKKSLSTIGSDSGGTEGIYAIDQALDMLSNDDSGNERYIIFMTDGEDDTISNSQIVESANACKTIIYTIGLGEVDDEQLKKIATETKGKYFYSSNADGLISIFEQTKEETVDYHSDSNGDGISDYYTKLISEDELRTGTGTLIADGYSYEELQASDDWDNDSIKNGEEIKITATPGKVTAYYASSPTSIENGAYRIIHSQSGKYLDIKDQSTINGAKLQLWKYAEGNQNQIINIQKNSNRNYILSPAHSHKSIEVKFASKKEGATISQWDYSDDECKQWKIIVNKDGTVSFKNVNSGKYFGAKDSHVYDGTLIVQCSDSISDATKFKLDRMNQSDVIGARWETDGSDLHYDTRINTIFNGTEVISKYAIHTDGYVSFPSTSYKSLCEIYYIDPETIDVMAWDEAERDVFDLGDCLFENLKALAEVILEEYDVIIPFDSLENLCRLANSSSDAEWNNFIKEAKICDANGSGIIVYKYVKGQKNTIYGPLNNATTGWGNKIVYRDLYSYDYKPWEWYEGDELDPSTIRSNKSGTWYYLYK